MVDNCSRGTMLTVVVGPCAGGDKEATVAAYNTLESYLVRRKSREKHDVLATERKIMTIRGSAYY